MAGLVVGEFAGVLAVAQNDHAVGAGINLAEAVGNVNDADALFAEFADEREEAVGLGEGEAGGGLIHDDEPGVQGEGLGNLDELLLGDGQPVHPGAGGDLEAEAAEQGSGVGVDLFGIDETEGVAGLAAKEDIGGGIEVAEDIQFLMDEGDAMAHGIVDTLDADGPAVDEDLPGVGLVHAAEDLHEGGFAGPVLAAEGDDLAGPDLQADVIKGVDAGKSFGNPAHFKKGRGAHGWSVRRITCRGFFSLRPGSRRRCPF